MKFPWISSKLSLKTFKFCLWFGHHLSVIYRPINFSTLQTGAADEFTQLLWAASSLSDYGFLWFAHGCVASDILKHLVWHLALLSHQREWSVTTWISNERRYPGNQWMCSKRQVASNILTVSKHLIFQATVSSGLRTAVCYHFRHIPKLYLVHLIGEFLG